MPDRWVIDVDAATTPIGPDDPEPWFAFCPIDDAGDIVLGMTFVSSEPPGPVVGCFSVQDEDLARTWAQDHRELLERWATTFRDPDQDGGDPPDNPSPSR